MKRMETIDEEVTALTLKFMDSAHKANKPFFIWPVTPCDLAFSRVQTCIRVVLYQIKNGLFALWAL